MTTVSTGNSYLDSLANSATTSGSTAGTNTSTSSSSIDQAGFLKLLTTQLQSQDPTSAQDTNQMVQQMATFSEVQGVTEMNTSLKSIVSSLASSRMGDASGWIGRGALVTSDKATALSSGAFAGEITLPTDAKDVTISLVNSDGQTVHSEDLGAKTAGAIDWSWDGKDTSGNAVAGPLGVVVSAASASGSGAVSTTNATWTEVQSVQSPATGTTKLITGLGTINPTDVLQLG